MGVKLSSKNQIVIPREAREALGAKAGSQLLVVVRNGSAIVRDDSTHRVYRLYDFTKAQQISPHGYYCISGKVNSADKLYLVMESVKPDTKHPRSSIVPAPSDGAEE